MKLSTILVMGLLLMGVAVAAYVAVLRPPAPVVRIATSPWLGYEPLFVARDLGMFADVGINIELIEYPALTDVAGAYIHGDVDGMCCTMVELVEVKRRSHREPTIVLVTDFSNGAAQVVVRPNIIDVASLKGRRIGMEAGFFSVYVLQRMLEGANLTLADVTIVSAEPSSLSKLAASGSVDAVVSYPPYVTPIVQLGWKPLFTSADIPGEIVDVIVLDKDLIDQHPELVSRLKLVWDNINAWMVAHPDEAHQRLGKRLEMTAEQVRADLAGMRTVSAAESDAALLPGGSAIMAQERIERLHMSQFSAQGVVHEP